MASDWPPTLRIRLEDMVALAFFLILVTLRLVFRSLEWQNWNPADVLIIIPAVTLLLAKEVAHYFFSRRRADSEESGGIPGFARPYWAIIRDWLPFLIVLLMYYSLWGDTTHLLVRNDQDSRLITWDQKLFGMQASVAIQRWITPALTAWMTFAYIFHILNVPIVACFIYLCRNRARFREMMCGVLVVCFFGLIGYVLVPAIGPLYTLRDQYTVPLAQSSSLFAYQVQFMDFARIRRDVFPSMHVGLSFLLWLYAYRNSKKLFAFLAPFILSLWVSTIYLRYHYLADVLAGLLLAPPCYWLANRLFARWSEMEISTAFLRPWAERLAKWGSKPIGVDAHPKAAPSAGAPSHSSDSGAAAPGESDKSGPGRRSNSKLLGLLVLCAALPYANSLLNDFLATYDDGGQILRNPYVHSVRHLRQIFESHVWSFQGAGSVTNYYRPVTMLGYLVCYKAFGPVGAGFHLANVGLHAGVVLLLLLVTLQLTSDRWQAAAAAALFAVHPVHTEPVDWISAAADLEVTFFCLLAFWFFLAGAGPRPRPAGAGSHAWALGTFGAGGSYLLALLSKEQALALPVLVTAYEHLFRPDRGATTTVRKAARYGIFWVLAGAYVLWRVHWLGAFAPFQQRPNLSLGQTWLAAIALTGKYCWKLVWPVSLCAYQHFPEDIRAAFPQVFAGLAVIALCGLLFWLLWRRDRAAGFGFVWFFLFLAPVLNVRWMGRNAFAERYLYLPSVGFCWLAAWAWGRLWRLTSERRPAWRRLLVPVSGAILALGAGRTLLRNRDWHDDITLYTRTLATCGDAPELRDALGLAYWLDGNFDAAAGQWQTSLRAAPLNDRAWNYLGGYFAMKKNYARAVECFDRSVNINPSYGDAHLNLALSLAEQGMVPRAEAEFRSAIALAPLNFQAHNLLGKLYWDAGRYTEAETEFRRSAAIDPNVMAYDYLGLIYSRWRDRKRAEQALLAALSLNPSDSRAHFGLGAIYAEEGEPARAVREYQAGLQDNPGDPEARAALEKLSQPASRAPNGTTAPRN